MIVGITGKIGSGKSTVAKLFALHGAKVIDVDSKAKELYFQKDVQQAVEHVIGISIVLPDGNIDFRKIAQHYFSSMEIYQHVNNLLYPILLNHIKHLIGECASTFLVLDAAMLFEIGLDTLCDVVVEVRAPFSLRWKRLKQRNPQMTYQDFLRRNRLQQSHRSRKLHVIYNDEKQSVLKQFEFLLQKQVCY